MILRNVEVLGSPGVRDVVIQGAEGEVVFDGALAFPGLINSHDHLEFNCYEQLGGGPYRDYVEWGEDIHRRHAATIAAVEAVPRALRVQMGIAKNLLCGVTAVAHHGPDPECPGAPIRIIGGIRSIHSPRLGQLRSMLVPDRRVCVAHVGEGIGIAAEEEIDRFLRWNVWRKPLIGVHAIAMRPDQAKRFAALVWCPASNEFLFGRTAPIASLKEHAPVLFGTDSTLTASWNIWAHLRSARESGALTDDELIAAVTTTAARVWNIDATGDIVVARRRHDDPGEAFFAINPQDVLLVLKNGAIVLADASLAIDAPLFPVVVSGVTKFVVKDYATLARKLRSLLRSIPVPISEPKF